MSRYFRTERKKRREVKQTKSEVNEKEQREKQEREKYDRLPDYTQLVHGGSLAKSPATDSGVMV